MMNEKHPPQQCLKRTGRRQTLALALLLAALIATSGCARLAEWAVPSREADIDLPQETRDVYDGSTQPQPSTAQPTQETTLEPTPAPTQASPTPTETAREWKTDLDEAFFARAEQLILTGLEKRQKEIALDELFERYWIEKDQVEATIEGLYDLYQSIYGRHPQFFYLSGSARISYALITGEQSRIKTMQLLPQVWPSLQGLDDLQLEELIAKVKAEADGIARSVAAQTQTPWQQLRLVHNALVQRIEYDTTENQDHNHAGSALLEGLTLCQGYSQAFQLVAHKLGHEVWMIMGESGGQGHAWNLVFLGDEVYHVDVTHDDPVPDGGPDHPVRHLHFMRSDAVMRETHQWDESLYPAAPSDGAHYYRQGDRLVSDMESLRRKLSQDLANHDFSSQPTLLFEVLADSGFSPTREAVDELFKDALQASDIRQRVTYRLAIRKNVVLLEVSLA